MKQRFELIINSEHKELMKKAAEIEGYSSLAAFMIKASLDKAKRVVKKDKENT